ncbi:hypothetical protein PILCRDRAFT_687000 [Piloderma croceum F 1598]|uniref:Uncharacterized protein n=1 Tax=Piloderma croceum (strain F 1598) TaxID=765440 RepID=A0A0C3ER55_PILCF|nr:hypothetical protein PILCRDRAFT_687000 [Piloderma croceum F 1598]
MSASSAWHDDDCSRIVRCAYIYASPPGPAESTVTWLSSFKLHSNTAHGTRNEKQTSTEEHDYGSQQVAPDCHA